MAVREQSGLREPVVAESSPQVTVSNEFAFRTAGMISIVAYSKMRN